MVESFHLTNLAGLGLHQAFEGVNLKVREDYKLNIVFVVVTRKSAIRYFWRYKLRPWYFGFVLVFRVTDQNFKIENDLRTLCLRNLLESTLEKNNQISVVVSSKLFC